MSGLAYAAVYYTGYTEGGDTVDDTAGDAKGTRRVDLKEAAVELGITSEAVRRRAKRGSLSSETGEDGRLYVWLPDVSDAGAHTGPHTVSDSGPHAADSPHLSEKLLERFEDENEFLRRELERLHRELERKDAILLTMAQRIPELEAVPEPREATEKVSEGANRGVHSEPDEPRSWWRRLFGAPQY